MPSDKSNLKVCYKENSEFNEIGVDEAGRGPMLGRVYSGAVILPKEDEFNHKLMKDSKRFSSEKRIREVAEYIKENAVAWGVGFITEEEIDRVNIRQATFTAMHSAITQVMKKHQDSSHTYHLLVDGNDFKPYTKFREDIGIVQILHTCIERGDNQYTAIAAASILAKVARDDYINTLCDNDPSLDEKYGLRKNKGYGTKKHMEGIEKYGITIHHRKTFGNCRLHV